MPHSPRTGSVAAQRTIAVVGDLWTLRILRAVFRGTRRHGDFITELGISRAVLSDRLARLVAQEVLVREAEAGRHPEYRLTERGLDLWSLFLAMWQWETDRSPAHDPDSWAIDRPRGRVFHEGCGRPMRPQLRCQACGAAVLPFDTRPLWTETAPAGGIAGATAIPIITTGGAVAPGAEGLPEAAFRRGRHARGDETQGLARVLGDRWSAAVIAAAFRGARQFAQFRQQLGIGPNQLSERLAELQDLGLLRPRPYAGMRQEYRLTRAGIALFPLILELLRWGNRWLAGPGEDYPVLHKPCGHELRARWHCDQCDGVLAREAVRFG